MHHDNDYLQNRRTGACRLPKRILRNIVAMDESRLYFSKSFNYSLALYSDDIIPTWTASEAT